MKILGIEFAPLLIPLDRRLQTLAVIYYVFLFLFLPFLSFFVSIYIFFWTQFWWLIPLYFMWFWYDFETPKKGSRPANWFRKMKVWEYLRDYFPIKLEKTCDLDPKKNYIFGYHPHGIMSVSMFTNFATDVTGFQKIFPGLKVRPLTLVGNFWFPFRRDLIMLSGGCDCSKESLNYLLNLPDQGQAVVLVVGGAVEALDAYPGRFDLILESRHGFIKVALQYGAQLVPVFSFGENDLYIQIANPPGSLLRKLQMTIKNICGFSPPVFSGRGIFNYSFGLLPYRKPVTTIVGKPILVEKTENPTKDQIAELHEKYKKGLVELFETNKKRFGIAAETHLNFH